MLRGQVVRLQEEPAPPAKEAISGVATQVSSVTTAWGQAALGADPLRRRLNGAPSPPLPSDWADSPLLLNRGRPTDDRPPPKPRLTRFLAGGAVPLAVLAAGVWLGGCGWGVRLSRRRGSSMPGPNRTITPSQCSCSLSLPCRSVPTGARRPSFEMPAARGCGRIGSSASLPAEHALPLTSPWSAESPSSWCTERRTQATERAARRGRRRSRTPPHFTHVVPFANGPGTAGAWPMPSPSVRWPCGSRSTSSTLCPAPHPVATARVHGAGRGRAPRRGGGGGWAAHGGDRVGARGAGRRRGGPCRPAAGGKHGTPGVSKAEPLRGRLRRAVDTPENPCSGQGPSGRPAPPLQEDPMSTRYRIIKLRSGWGVEDTRTGAVWTGMVHVGAVQPADRLNAAGQGTPGPGGTSGPPVSALPRRPRPPSRGAGKNCVTSRKRHRRAWTCRCRGGRWTSPRPVTVAPQLRQVPSKARAWLRVGRGSCFQVRVWPRSAIWVFMCCSARVPNGAVPAAVPTTWASRESLRGPCDDQPPVRWLVFWLVRCLVR